MQENQNEYLTIVAYGLPSRLFGGGVKFVESDKRSAFSSRYKVTWGKEIILPHERAYPLTMGCTIRGCGENLCAAINTYLVEMLRGFPETKLAHLIKSNFEPLLVEDRCWRRAWEIHSETNRLEIAMNVCPFHKYKQLWTEHEWRKFMVQQFLAPFHLFLILPRELSSENDQNRHCSMKQTGKPPC